MTGLISLADAKKHLHVEHEDDDAYITALIAAAGARIEAVTGFVCPARVGEEFTFDRFRGALELRLRPVDAGSIAVAYLDGNGDSQSFADFRVYEKNGTTRIAPDIGASWPSVACVPAAVTVTADVGIAAATDEVEADCGANLKHAARLLVGHWYRNREAVNVGNIVTEFPQGVEALLEPDRLIKI